MDKNKNLRQAKKANNDELRIKTVVEARNVMVGDKMFMYDTDTRYYLVDLERDIVKKDPDGVVLDVKINYEPLKPDCSNLYDWERVVNVILKVRDKRLNNAICNFEMRGRSPVLIERRNRYKIRGR